MRWRFVRGFCWLGFFATTSCYSFAITRHEVKLMSRQATTWLYVWESDQQMAENLAEHAWPVQILLITLSQPFNMLFGALAGLHAPFDADYDIRLGPFGFAAGVVIPGLTVMPALMRGPGRSVVEVDDETYRRLLENIDAGNGVASFQAAAGQQVFHPVLDVARAPLRLPPGR